jgi:hypothetical protein
VEKYEIVLDLPFIILDLVYEVHMISLGELQLLSGKPNAHRPDIRTWLKLDAPQCNRRHKYYVHFLCNKTINFIITA